eukprot:760875-Pleurochrysis_carterae.AAC.1
MVSLSAKVRAIYDALDARNTKQALKLCNSALAKGEVPLVLALKAVALQRSGKPDEALTICRQVVDGMQVH